MLRWSWSLLMQLLQLEAMGFDRALVLEVFFACNKNEELAANYLLDHMHEFEEWSGLPGILCFVFFHESFLWHVGWIWVYLPPYIGVEYVE